MKVISARHPLNFELLEMHKKEKKSSFLAAMAWTKKSYGTAVWGKVTHNAALPSEILDIDADSSRGLDRRHRLEVTRGLGHAYLGGELRMLSRCGRK